MKKYIISILMLCMLLSCEKNNKVVPKDIISEQEVTLDNEELSNENNSSVEIFKYDSYNITQQENIELLYYLPNENTYLKTIDGFIFENNYKPLLSSGYEYDTHSIRITEDNDKPFYQYMAEADGHTYVSFYYNNDFILMRVDHYALDPRVYDEENEAPEEGYKHGNLKMDVIFKKE